MATHDFFFSFSFFAKLWLHMINIGGSHKLPISLIKAMLEVLPNKIKMVNVIRLWLFFHIIYTQLPQYFLHAPSTVIKAASGIGTYDNEIG